MFSKLLKNIKTFVYIYGVFVLSLFHSYTFTSTIPSTASVRNTAPDGKSTRNECPPTSYYAAKWLNWPEPRCSHYTHIVLSQCPVFCSLLFADEHCVVNASASMARTNHTHEAVWRMSLNCFRHPLQLDICTRQSASICHFLRRPLAVPVIDGDWLLGIICRLLAARHIADDDVFDR